MKTRRAFLAGTLAIGGASYLELNGWTDDALAQCVPVPNQPTLRVRPDINSLAPNHPIIEAYKTAIVAMKALPSNNPVSWQYQAAIHNNLCPHGNWFFLPWHRAYLNYFEQIIRKLSGYSQFVLPYWNWTNNPQVPAVFWGAGNPLSANRAIGPNGTIPAELVGPNVIAQIMAIPDFQQFGSYSAPAPRGFGAQYGALEGTSHNGVHNAIGGQMGTMLSPLDPLFWLHHANVDRLWALWNASGRSNTTNSSWTGYVFKNNFVNADGKIQSIGICNLQRTYQLGYRYPDQPAPLLLRAQRSRRTRRRPVRVGRNLRRITGRDILRIVRRARIPNPAVMPGVLPTLNIPLLRAEITPATFPIGSRSFVRVFLGSEPIDPNTPSTDPRYVGAFSLFGHGDDPSTGGHHIEHALKGQFHLDLNLALERLKRLGTLPADTLQLQFVSTPMEGEPTPPGLLQGDTNFGILD